MKHMVAACLMLSLGTRFGYAEVVQPTWGTIHEQAAGTGVFRLEVSRRPVDGRLEMPTPFAHVTRCYSADADQPRSFDFEFNEDASRLALLLPPVDMDDVTTKIIVETSETTTHCADGRIVFSAVDADVSGTQARLESHAGNHRIGFWTNASDHVSWKFDATRWGMYTVFLTYSTASPDGSLIDIEVGGETTSVALRSTGSWYRYTTVEAGTVYLVAVGEQTLTVKCAKLVGGAVMNLKAVSLVPACEGKPPVQADDGVIVLHGRDATVRGTMLRYEPAEKKQTLGYWVRASDSAEWQFTVTQPGSFDIEVLQGCGPGQGGSDVLIDVADQEMRFVVEDTGHFQNFKPRIVGRVELPSAGTYGLTVAPEKIAKQAAMDLRQVRLIPSR